MSWGQIVFWIFMGLCWLFLLHSIYMIKFGIAAHSKNPIRFFKSGVSDDEFTAIQREIFDSPAFKYDKWRVAGGRYIAWVANGEYGVEFYRVLPLPPTKLRDDFSWLQRHRFIKEFNVLKAQRQYARVEMIAEREWLLV